MTQPKSSGTKIALIVVGVLGALFVLGTAFVAVIVMVVFGAMKSSDAYRHGLERARSNPAVVARLGEPIEEPFAVTGSVNVSGSSGNADLSFSLSGPRGEGTVYVVAEKSGGEWVYSRVEFQPDGSGERIDLVATNAEAE